MARRFQADLRKLLKQYPRLTTAEGQARLNGYMSTQLDTEENTMPPKGQRSFGEDTALLSVRLPVSIIADIDAHVVRLRRLKRWRIGRVDAMCDLLTRAFDAIAAEEAAPGVSTAVQATPPLSEATVQTLTEKLAKTKDLLAEQGDHIERMHDLIEAIPERIAPLESAAAEDDQAAVSEEPQPPLSEGTAAVLPTVTKPGPAKAKSRPRIRKGAAK
jgi:hypothetical protein